MARRAARVLSTLFQPVLTGTYVLLAVSAASAASTREAVLWGVGTALVTAGVPALDIARRIRGRTVTDFHIVIREQRFRPLLVALGCTAAALLAAAAWDAPRPLTVALLVALVTGSVLTAITRFWKISFHAATAASAVALMVWLLGPWALVLLPLPPAVAWSRVSLRRHSPSQVVAGAAVGLTLTVALVVVC